MAIGDNQIGTEGAVVRRSSVCILLTAAIPTTGRVLDLVIPRGAFVSKMEFYTGNPPSSGSETMDVGWTAGTYNLPGTQTGLTNEAGDDDGIGTLTNANLRSSGRIILNGGAALQQKRFTADVNVVITPSAATAQTGGRMLFHLYYVVD